MGLLATGAAAMALAWSSTAEAAEPRDDRPWGRGTMVPTFGLGAGGLFSDIATLNFGLGFNYYIVNGLSAGLSFSDTILIYKSAFKARYPGIEDQLPTNVFDITPTLQYVFFRSRRFSPYVYGGAGPVFFNHGAGTYGQWVAGPGVFLNVAGPLYVNLGVGFSGIFPTDQCQDALTYTPSDPDGTPLLLDLCSFRWGPQLGMVLAFGGKRESRRERRARERREREAPRSYPPATNPMDEAVEPDPPAQPTPPPRTAPAAPVEPAPGGAPTDVAPPPADAPPPSGAPTDVTPPPETPPASGAPTDVAPPPSSDAPTDVAPPPSSDAPTDVAPPPAKPPSSDTPTDVAPPPDAGPSGDTLADASGTPDDAARHTPHFRTVFVSSPSR